MGQDVDKISKTLVCKLYRASSKPLFLHQQTLYSMAEMQQYGVEIELDAQVAEGIYSNLVLITHSTSEFIIDFAAILPGLPRAVSFSRPNMPNVCCVPCRRISYTTKVRLVKSRFRCLPRGRRPVRRWARHSEVLVLMIQTKAAYMHGEALVFLYLNRLIRTAVD